MGEKLVNLTLINFDLLYMVSTTVLKIILGTLGQICYAIYMRRLLKPETRSFKKSSQNL